METKKVEEILKLINGEAVGKINRKLTMKGVLKELHTLRVFRQVYGSPEVVLKKIFEVRSSKANLKCPNCGSDINLKNFRPIEKLKYKCRLDPYTISPLVGTPLTHTHMKLHFIMELIFRMIQSKHGLTGLEVARDYGIGKKAAADTLTRIRTWMGMYTTDTKFDENSYVELDEVYPLKPTGLGRGFKWSRGMGSERIAKTITMVQRGHGLAKGFVVDEVNKETVDLLVNQHLSKTNKLRTDEKRVYQYLSSEKWDHDSCNHAKKEWVKDDAHTNTCESLHSIMQGNIRTVYRGVKYTQRYVDETTFVFSHRGQSPYEAIENLFNVLPPLCIEKPLKQVA